MCKALRSWWRDKYIYRSKTVTMTTKCKRDHSHVYSTVLNGSTNWPWSGAMINKVRAWEIQILRLTFRPGRMPDEPWVTYKNQNIAVHEGLLAEDGPATAVGENCKQNLDNYDVGRV